MQRSEPILLISQDATGPWEKVRWIMGWDVTFVLGWGLGMRPLGTLEWKDGGEKPGVSVGQTFFVVIYQRYDKLLNFSEKQNPQLKRNK